MRGQHLRVSPRERRRSVLVRGRQLRRHVVRRTCRSGATCSQPFGAVPVPAAADQGRRPGASSTIRQATAVRRQFQPIEVPARRRRDHRGHLRRVLHARRTGSRTAPPRTASSRRRRPQKGNGACSHDGAGRASTRRRTGSNAELRRRSRRTSQPIFEKHGCNAGSCHGAPQSDFYITCGADDTQIAFNFSAGVVVREQPGRGLADPARPARGRGRRPRPHRRRSVLEHRRRRLRGDLQLGDRRSACSTSRSAIADKQFFKDNVQPILVSARLLVPGVPQRRRRPTTSSCAAARRRASSRRSRSRRTTSC